MNTRTLVLSFVLIATTSAFYSNQEALDCFSGKAISQCSQYADQCLEDYNCQAQLELYNKCSFGSSDQELNHIFNGYCFRRWREQALHSRRLIDCFNQQCQLDYNSPIGSAQLYACSQWVMLEEEVECDHDCLLEMGTLVGQAMTSTPLTDLYQQEFQSPQAARIANLIFEHCIQEGPGKLLIEQEERVRHNRAARPKEGVEQSQSEIFSEEQSEQSQKQSEDL